MNFIHGINHSSKDESIINVILTLAKSLEIGIVAEGVENKSQLSFLTSRQCSVIQGYYFYKPMSTENLSEHLREYVAI
jgi:EAL domain-containing protein (putative c-di-GMP-specific phosphodiesterase class I)